MIYGFELSEFRVAQLDLTKLTHPADLADGDLAIIARWKGNYSGRLVMRHGCTLISIGHGAGQSWPDITKIPLDCEVVPLSPSQARSWLSRLFGDDQAAAQPVKPPSPVRAMVRRLRALCWDDPHEALDHA